jgi:hypothetical protein
MEDKEVLMKTTLRVDHGLFQRLTTNPPLWWNNLKADKDLYIDIRKNNSINVYYNGGSILKLEGGKAYKAQIHSEYIPLQRDHDYVSYRFDGESIELEETETISINSFEADTIDRIKKRIRKFYPNDSEKGIQGRYVVKTNILPNSSGFFIDTEFAYEKKRIDMVWVDLKTRKIALVELKTIGDERLYVDKQKTQETIDQQLQKYHNFARQNSNDLMRYYARVFRIKRDLGLLPGYATNAVESLEGFELIEKPVLLIGDCTEKWIKKHSPDLERNLKDIAFGCVYRGRNTPKFKIPYETSRHCHRY